MAQAAEGAPLAAVVARTKLGAPCDAPARTHAQPLPGWSWRVGELGCRVVSRAELQDIPLWRSTFASSRKDHRYYEIVEDTVRDRFDYRYFVITDPAGDALAIQPFFVMDQDMLEGVASTSRCR